MELLNDKTLSSSLAYPTLIDDWGLIAYAPALERQHELVDRVRQGLSPETLVFCTHSPVVTLGRGTQDGDVFGWSGERVEVNRGGRATYHGPNQVIVYPILDLGKRGRDLHKYMRTLEQAIIETLIEFDITAQTRADATGVWIGSRKIASIGIGVRGWVSFHGLALNVENDPQAFQGLKPCGFQTETMISMEEILGHRPDRERLKTTLGGHLNNLLV